MPRGGFRPGAGSKPGEKRGKYKVKSTIRKEFEALDISHLGPKFLRVLENALDDPDPRIQRWAFEQMRQYVFVPQTPAQGGNVAGLVLNLTMPQKETIDTQNAVQNAIVSVENVDLLPEPPAPVEPERQKKPTLPEGAEMAPNFGSAPPPEDRNPSAIEIAAMTEEEYEAYLDRLAEKKKASVQVL